MFLLLKAIAILLIPSVCFAQVYGGGLSSVPTAEQIVGQFGSGSCLGYLKSDGTCDTAADYTPPGSSTPLCGDSTTVGACTNLTDVAPIAGTLGTSANYLPKASGTGGKTAQASGISEDGTAVRLGSLKLVATGSISGGVPMITKSDNYTLGTDDAQEAYGYIVWMSGSGKTLTLPPVAAEMSVCLYSTDASAKNVDPNASDGIRNGAARNADGHKITSGGNLGDFVCLVADSADGWTVMGKSGTWSDE